MNRGGPGARHHTAPPSPIVDVLLPERHAELAVFISTIARQLTDAPAS